MWLIAAKSSGSSYLIYIFGAAYIAFFFFYLRPRMRRTKELKSQARVMDVGDKVQTIGGLIGTIRSIDQGVITLETASGTELQFLRGAVQQRYVEPTPPIESEGESQGDGA